MKDKQPSRERFWLQNFYGKSAGESQKRDFCLCVGVYAKKTFF